MTDATEREGNDEIEAATKAANLAAARDAFQTATVALVSLQAAVDKLGQSAEAAQSAVTLANIRLEKAREILG